MKIVHTFFNDENGNLIKSDCKAVIKGKVFDCDLYKHFSRYVYLNNVEKRESYHYIDCTHIEDANIHVHISEA